VGQTPWLGQRLSRDWTLGEECHDWSCWLFSISLHNKETSGKGRQPRRDTEETIEVDMEEDEIMGDNTAEEHSRPLYTNTTAFNFNPNSSGIEASIYNFRAQDVPKTPSMTIFEDRVEASSPIQQSTQTAMAVPKSIRYPQSRKRKTTTVLADTTTLGTTRTPLGDVNGNRGATTFTIETTRAVGNDTECLDVEMTQGEPKMVCTDVTAAPRRGRITGHTSTVRNNH
jgi:hypothetical protein